ncbi:uncharacterized protein LOC124433761 isoform X2 [Xenia sp. Carnegie-2017]|uniref:uncharacterized protein LOC124433761 isoform X2 n=1 Tax=Xenia sp. Carnegie-2017 TaxID=2897299 RepID=UPI001F03DA95|nr:uncharacterized protein LOC124433761 isoform X2 [Xenia sp. Carnegie-2017]
MWSANFKDMTHFIVIYSWISLALVTLSPKSANCANVAVVWRSSDGDKFTNPFDNRNMDSCRNANAHCFTSPPCIFCKCNKERQTYRMDSRTCISSRNVRNITGCKSLGQQIQHGQGYITDQNLPILDFSRKGRKYVRFLGLSRMAQGYYENTINCDIKNSSAYLSNEGDWRTWPNVNDIFTARAQLMPNDAIFLVLEWEKVDKKYLGLIAKLMFSCSKANDNPETGCFVFKSEGNQSLDVLPTPTTKMTISTLKFNVIPTTKPKVTSAKVTVPVEREDIIESKTFSVPMSIIIGVSVGVCLVIIVVILFAVCFVRHRTRKHPQPKVSQGNSEPPPKVHMTTQARFGLIQDTTVIEVDDEDYTSLKTNRESYDPYCSLSRDNADMNVIETILKDAASMESISASYEPRYSCHLSKNNGVIIESVKSPLRNQSSYPLLKRDDDVTEDDDSNDPDYEEMDDDEYNTLISSSGIPSVKPPLPDRVYHELEPPRTRHHSESL